MLRNVYGSSEAEAFLIIAIITILVTRLYLVITGFPQIGNGTLHIAHALWGGASMMVALLVGWLFLGTAARTTAIVLGGIGFGLFLDEIGKFVTQSNDYFYGPSAEIMYVMVVTLLVINRCVRDFRQPNADECLANAAHIASEGIIHGLTDRRRQDAQKLLRRALDLTGNKAPELATKADAIGVLINTARGRTDWLYALEKRAARLIPGVFKKNFWVPLVGWLLVISSLIGVVGGIIQLAVGGISIDTDSTQLEVDRMSVSGVILFISAILTVAVALPAMIARHRGHTLRALRALRLAALIYTTLNALVDFAVDRFGALTGVAIGLFAMAIFSYHISNEQTVHTPEAHD
ncbi:MAG: hypothetical protein GX542_06320 [Rhodococcus sp.]|nr:hypothetical protein [Rhodococcus sp. (in: high G+C Gram-positive bacteria)]